MMIPFGKRLAALRRERGINQRRAAADLQISQALLSHYETGAREPGLAFVCRACEYYGVSADYLLGRDDSALNAKQKKETLLSVAEQLRLLAEKTEACANE